MKTKQRLLIALLLLGVAIGFAGLLWTASQPYNECMAKTCRDPAKHPVYGHGQCICAEVPQ